MRLAPPLADAPTFASRPLPCPLQNTLARLCVLRRSDARRPAVEEQRRRDHEEMGFVDRRTQKEREEELEQAQGVCFTSLVSSQRPLPLS